MNYLNDLFDNYIKDKRELDDKLATVECVKDEIAREMKKLKKNKMVYKDFTFTFLKGGVKVTPKKYREYDID
jgi:hypothetical protein